MGKRYFGTDGIRGRVNEGGLTAQTALTLGLAAGKVFLRGTHKHRVVIGKDTRLSGYSLEPALAAGLTSMGMDVFLFGPIPTAGVAFLTRSLRADMGIMLSASHNPFEDNGFKLFGPDGYKLSDELECKIEDVMGQDLVKGLVPPANLGRAKRIDDAQARYIEFVKQTYPRHMTLDGMKIVVDCAHGASYKVAPAAFWELGADIIPIGVAPNGFNINNQCGSTDMRLLSKVVVKEGADMGIAFDGDGDRVLVCDELGRVIDGDQIIACLATYWKASNRLKTKDVVGTIMSNLELENYLGSKGLSLHRTQVGDRYVGDYMRQNGFNLGGEPSGHILMSDFATTGDGLVAALQLLAMIRETNKLVSEVCHPFCPLPQLVKNAVPKNIADNISPANLVDPATPTSLANPANLNNRGKISDLLDKDEVKKTIQNARAQLGTKGRVVVRPSGTEPVIRVMVEGEDEALLDELSGLIVDAIEAKTL